MSSNLRQVTISTSRGSSRRIQRSQWLGLFVGLVVLCCLLPTGLMRFCVWRGTASLQSKDNASALRWLQRAEWLDDDRGEVKFQLAQANRRLGQYETAEKYLRRALQVRWDVTQVTRERWLIAAQTQQFDGVVDHWDDLLADPRDDVAEICNAFVVWCITRVRPQDALVVIAAWERDYPTDPQPHFLRGLIWDGVSQWTTAADEFRRAIELAPDRSDAHFHLAEDLVHLNRYQDAEEQFRLCLETDPSNCKAIAGRAKCLEKLGRGAEALEIVTSANVQHAHDPDVLQALADLELVGGKAAQAREHLEEVIRQRPESQGAHYALAMALQALGKSESAKKELAIVEESEKGLNRLATLCQQLVKHPDDVAIRYEWALLTWKYRSRREGAERLKSLLTQAPGHVQAHAALAQHYALLGDHRRAEYHRRQAASTETAHIP